MRPSSYQSFRLAISARYLQMAAEYRAQNRAGDALKCLTNARRALDAEVKEHYLDDFDAAPAPPTYDFLPDVPQGDTP